MQLGFDAKRAFYNQTGLGNYGRGVISCLQEFNPEIDLHFYAPKRKGMIDEQILNMGETHYLNGPLKNFNRFFNLSSKIKKNKLDIYHGLSNEIPLKISKANVKTVVTIHDIIFLKFPQYYKSVDRKIYYYKTLYAVQNADLIITTSNQTLNDLENEFGCGNKCKTVYQHANFNFDTTQTNAPITAPYFLFISSFEKRKNHLNLIQAFAEVKDQIPQNLVLIGRKKDTWLAVNQMIKKLNLEDRIKLVENASEVQINQYLQHASGFIYPSLYEGFGIPMLEAMRYQIPIACANLPVFREIVEDGAIYFDSKSVFEIKNALIELNNPQITKKNKELLTSRLNFFSAQTHANSLVNAYNSLF